MNNVTNNLPINFIISDPYNRYSPDDLVKVKGVGYKVIVLNEADFQEGNPSHTETYYAILEAVQPRMHLDKGFAVIVHTSREKDDPYFSEFYKFFKQVVTTIAADLIPYESLQRDRAEDEIHAYSQYRVYSV